MLIRYTCIPQVLIMISPTCVDSFSVEPAFVAPPKELARILKKTDFPLSRQEIVQNLGERRVRLCKIDAQKIVSKINSFVVTYKLK